eukprot:maker-scaffold474_size162001-snap-gene-0.35 protein:Tk10288 transcript:maker-scaffold474_size162001-snap-gene-0.35-mRNA-1 annotation:"fggy carbohydrate kinase domain-containing"
MASTTDCFYIGVDVGTGSVRAGLVNAQGRVLRTASQALKIHNPRPDYFEQSSQDVWKGVIHCVKAVVKDVEDKFKVRGIGFDATCSLVVAGGQPFSYNNDPLDEWDIIMWMDHRAKIQTEFINKSSSPQVQEVLQFVGSQISVEMQVPKLMWIKEKQPEVWRRASDFFDLSDYLTFRATGGDKTRSLCSTVCKWTYLANMDGSIKGPGQRIGEVGQDFAAATGLASSTVVGASLIDAHAGVLGMLACTPARNSATFEEQLCMIAGTSTCHMALSRGPRQVTGIWGPYLSAILPGFWLLEGGQTAVGKLIDHILESHPAYEASLKAGRDLGSPSIQAYLEGILEDIRVEEGLEHVAYITRSLHIWPDFHGNRSPLANPYMTGMICGLTLDKGTRNLAKCYLAAVQSVTYGTAHIIEAMKIRGQIINVVTVCGGLSKSELFVQTQADVLGLPVIQPQEKESVLLGSAMLGAAAACQDTTESSGALDNLTPVVNEMMCDGKIFSPNLNVRKFHERKYRIFRLMGEDQLKYTSLMDS